MSVIGLSFIRHNSLYIVILETNEKWLGFKIKTCPTSLINTRFSVVLRDCGKIFRVVVLRVVEKKEN